MNRTKWTVGALVAVGGFVLGCGSAPPSEARAGAAIRGAHEVRAEGTPQAAYHLQLARDQVALAQQMSARGEMVEARRMLRRAQADAEVSIALAGVGRERADAEEMRRHISDMSAR